MINECKNCGGNVFFSPKDKGNVCENCGSVFAVNYDRNVVKKDFAEAKKLNNVSDSKMVNVKCGSCGASMMLHKNDIKAVCPYCDSATISEAGEQKMMDIDGIVPFAFNKDDALKVFNHQVSGSFFANKKIFKGLNKEDFKGVYINAFIFDLNTNIDYKGTFSYTESYTNSKGERKTKTVYKHVSGSYNRFFDNLTVEANSNLNQNELMQILPYNYAENVKFDADFTHGYSFEHHNEVFDDCFIKAEDLMKKMISNELLKKYNCDRVVSLDLKINYNDKKYNYCLLPVYFVNKKYKDKTYNVLMNGQSGKLSKLPKSVAKILLVIFMVLGFVAGIVCLAMFL